jgi:hypothetical protein
VKKNTKISQHTSSYHLFLPNQAQKAPFPILSRSLGHDFTLNLEREAANITMDPNTSSNNSEYEEAKHKMNRITMKHLKNFGSMNIKDNWCKTIAK